MPSGWRNDHLYRVSLDTRWHKVGTKFLQLLFVRKATTWKLEHWITLTNFLISHNWCWQSLVQNLWKGSHAKKFPTSYPCSLTADQLHMEPKHGDIVDDVLTQICRFSQFYKIFPWPFWSLKFTTANWPIFRLEPGHSSKMRSTSKSSQSWPKEWEGTSWEYQVHPRKLTWIPKMMVWKWWTPLKYCHVWYLCLLDFWGVSTPHQKYPA